MVRQTTGNEDLGADLLPADWREALGPEGLALLARPLAEVAQAEAAGVEVYPPAGQRFAAFVDTPFAAVRTVILGQDPYHGPGQAMGLSFSVPPDLKKLPPSLRNIFKELADDCAQKPPRNGDLTPWARHGVLLLNAVLTVPAGQAGAHAQFGWEPFTDHVIKVLSRKRQHLVFVLWGNYAKKKAALIAGEHLVLISAHPSPLSARHGFFKSKPFSKANAYLAAHHQPPIDWRLPNA